MTTQVTYTSAMKLTAAAFDGVSDRLIHLAASTALTYLAGVNGWNTDKKIPAETVREQLVDTFQTSGNKRTTAYTFAQTGWKLAARLSKGDKAFRETLKASDLQDAVNLIVVQIKADLQAGNLPLTMDGLKALLEGPKKDAKPAKGAAEKILTLLNADDSEFSDQELEDILAAVRGLVTARAQHAAPLQQAA